MSSNVAIRAVNLHKSYRIAHNTTKHATLTEAVISRMRHPLHRRTYERFDALDSVSFEVTEGEVLGVIGRNGAGKSTLLKILTRITAPTSGQVELFGRVGSLLEVGTGFHPELTGKENIYLNGAILGMRQREMDRRFDDIVEFSGVERFIDTPVKRFSSGMYVRLAFAVASHLDTDILIVDEVLAVGDAEFQRRCLGKMSDAASEGRTVIFVSHQLEAVSTLCTKAMHLERGRNVFFGDVTEAIRRYMRDAKTLASVPDQRPGTGEIRLVRARPDQASFRCDEVKRIRLTIERCLPLTERYCVLVWIYGSEGRIITQCDSRLLGLWFEPCDYSELVVTVRSPWLQPGRYDVGVALRLLGQANSIDEVYGACELVVMPILPYPTTTDAWASDQGVVLGDFTIEAQDRG